MSRIGGIVGIILGEYQFLHLNTTVIVVMGVITLLSAMLFQFLPDLTQHKKMPCSLDQFEDIQLKRNIRPNAQSEETSGISL